MTNCLYVGNLPHECTDEELRTLFLSGGHEPQSVTIVVDRKTGRSRGFGFVTMDSEETAATALESLQGVEMTGRTLRLGTARKDRRDSGNAKNAGWGESNERSFRGPRRGKR